MTTFGRWTALALLMLAVSAGLAHAQTQSGEILGRARVVRKSIRIETGFNAEGNAQLSVSAIEETITARAASPVVETRSSTTGQTFNVTTANDVREVPASHVVRVSVRFSF